MFNLTRFIPALVLIAMYTLIVLSPLAPLALRSPVIAHAITGECASDCSICGCSPERSANHTCCCWIKKQTHQPDNDLDEPECCKKKHADNNNKTASINSRPCNSSKSILLPGGDQSDVLPFHFSQGSYVEFETDHITCTPVYMADWPGVPPDPPPKLT